MLSIKVTGLEKLQRELEEAQRAFESLDGTIATLRFNPDDPASVKEAIRQMEAAVDAKATPYRTNRLVASIVAKVKDAYREKIRKMAASRRGAVE